MAEDAPADPSTTRLAALEAGQTAIIGALGLMLDTLHQQTNLLHELAAAVQEDPGPSPVMRSLDELTGAVVQMGAGIETLGHKLDALPEAIGAALEGEAVPPGAGGIDTREAG